MPPSLVGLRAALKPSSSPPDVAEPRGLYSGLPDRELRQLSLEEMFSLGEATANRAGLTDATFITLGQRYEKLTGWMPGRVVFELLQARKYIQTHVVIVITLSVNSRCAFPDVSASRLPKSPTWRCAASWPACGLFVGLK